MMVMRWVVPLVAWAVVVAVAVAAVALLRGAVRLVTCSCVISSSPAHPPHSQAVRTRRRTKDLDQVQDAIRKQDEEGGPKPKPRDDDLPGCACGHHATCRAVPCTCAGGDCCALTVNAVRCCCVEQPWSVLLHRVRSVLHLSERQGQAHCHQAAQAKVCVTYAVHAPLPNIQHATTPQHPTPCCPVIAVRPRRAAPSRLSCAHVRLFCTFRFRLKHTREPQYTHKEAAAGAGQGSTATHVMEHVRTKRVGGGVAAGAGAAGGVVYGGRASRSSRVVDPATIPVVTDVAAVGNTGDIVM